MMAVTVTVLIFTIGLISQADAWGKEGHEIVANIAYNRLTTETKSKVDALLNLNYTDPNYDFATPLAAVANWADKVRFTSAYHWTTPLHYVDVRDEMIDGGCPCTSSAVSFDSNSDDQTLIRDSNDDNLFCSSGVQICAFDYERDCEEGKCAVGAIVKLSQKLHNSEKKKWASQATITKQKVNDFFEYSKESKTQLLQTRQKRQLRGIVVNNMNFRQKDTLGTNMNNMVEFSDKRKGGDYSFITDQQSLMFITHFIGDIHQPLHCSRQSDKGGNTIKVTIPFSSPDMEGLHKHGWHDSIRYSGWNLHSIWDDAIIRYAISEFYHNSQDTFQKDIEAKVLSDENIVRMWISCGNGIQQECVTQWAEESFDNSLKWSYGDEQGMEIKSGAILSVQYFLTRLPIVEKSLAAAGVRLAASLESIFGDG